MKRLAPSLVPVLVLALSSVMVASQTAKPKIYGIGVQPCADWLLRPGEPTAIGQMEASAKEMAVISWVTGYVTGAAAILAERGTVLRDTTGRDLLASITKHCESNKGSTVEVAAAALVRELSGR